MATAISDALVRRSQSSTSQWLARNDPQNQAQIQVPDGAHDPGTPKIVTLSPAVDLQSRQSDQISHQHAAHGKQADQQADTKQALQHRILEFHGRSPW